MLGKYIGELAFENHVNGLEVAQKLIDEHYVVMLSKEENLLILNYTYSQYANRNDVVFMSHEEFDDKYYEMDENRNCDKS